MEVNIDNSFSIAMRIIWQPFRKRCYNILNHLEKQLSNVTVFILQSPLFTTLLISTLVVTMFILISYSVIVLLGVFFFTSVVLMAEGFVVVVLLCTLCISSMIPIFILTLFTTVFVRLNNT